MSDWFVQLERVSDEQWLGWLKPAGARQACAVVVLSDDDVEELDIDTRPLEWLQAQTAPSDSGPIVL